MTIGQLTKVQAWLAVASAVLFLWIVLKKGGPA
jgi:hypothetical protein